MSDTTLRRKRAAVAAATAAVGSAAAPAIFPAPAAAAPGGCPGNTLCEWQFAGFDPGGPVMWWSPYGSDNTYGNNTFPGGRQLNDNVSSVWNNSNRWVRLCIAAGCNGNFEPGLCLGPGGAVAQLSNIGYNGNLSSHYTYNSFPGNCWEIVQSQGCSM